jgi:hypothetical protein
MAGVAIDSFDGASAIRKSMKDRPKILDSLRRAEFETSSRLLIAGIFVACLIWSTLMATVGWGNTISDANGFRQTQTAITSYYLARGGPFLRYETPIFGAPWSIPFEFPVYQWIVALTSKILHLRLEQSGRLVNEVFFVLTLLTFWAILSELRVDRAYRLIFLSLVLVSPQYVFWSRTFMIESTALFFSMAYLYFILRYIRTKKILDAGIGGLCGLLSALIKVTTFPAFALVGGGIYVYSEYRGYRSAERPKPGKLLLAQLVPMLFFACLPIMFESIWVLYTDQVRSFNIVAHFILSNSNLRTWNFGTLAQRFQAPAWIILRVRSIPDVIGAPISLLVSCLGLLLSRHRIVPFLISIGGFLSAFLIFTNLHYVHHYYVYSNGVFLLAAVSWGIVGLVEGLKWRKLLGIAVFLFCIFNSIERYYDYSYQNQKNNATQWDSLAAEIRNSTQPTDVVLIFSEDWSSEIPYYSERRALIWPRWMERDLDAPTMREAISRLGNNKIGAIVFCDGAQTNTRLIGQAVDKFEIASVPHYADAMCAVYPSSGPRSVK